MSDQKLKEISDILLGAHSVLILTHIRPDGDALGSSFGMRQFLREAGINAEVFLPEAPPERYRELCTGYIDRDKFNGFDRFDLILLLDCASFNRIGFAPDIKAVPPEKLLNVDHHVTNSITGKYNYIDGTSSSSCEIASAIATISGQPISKECATLFLLGIITDTGSFRFSNTNGKCLRSAAKLLDAGADLETLVNTAYFSDSINQLQLEADIVNHEMKLAFSGRFAYAFLSDELLAKYNFDLKESENIIDILRRINTVVIAILIYRKDDGFKISLRSKDCRYPVLGIAQKFNGGGHLLAGGATIHAENFSEVESLLLDAVGELLEK